MKLLPRQLLYINIKSILIMMDLQRMPKDVTEYRYCVTGYISLKICWLFPLFVKICFKMFNPQWPAYAITDTHIVRKSS